jgi:hypothetical protein
VDGTLQGTLAVTTAVYAALLVRTQEDDINELGGGK